MFGQNRLANARAGILWVNTFCAHSGGFSLLIDKASQEVSSLKLRFRRITWNAQLESNTWAERICALVSELESMYLSEINDSFIARTKREHKMVFRLLIDRFACKLVRSVPFMLETVWRTKIFPTFRIRFSLHCAPTCCFWSFWLV